MTRRDLFMFAGGLVLGAVATCLVIQSIPRRVSPLTPAQPLVLELKPSEPVPVDGHTDLKTDDIRSMLQRLAKAAGVKLVLSDQVRGSVTMELDPDTSPREAINIIVAAKGLVMHEGQGTLYVKTSGERAPEPTERGQYTFRNARAADVKKLLVRQLRSSFEPSVDERTNTIFYVEDRSNVEVIKKFLDFIDQPVPARQ